VKSRDSAGNLSVSQDFTFTTASPDTSAPTASLTAADITTAGDSTYTFTVTFTDNVAVKVSTLSSADIQVTGPNGFSQTATFVSVNTNTNGTVRTATYRISAPGGAWDQGDNGNYTVSVVASQVSDTSSNFVAAGSIGTFAVAVPDSIGPTLSAITASGLTTSGATITWNSSEAADSRVEYGLSTSYGSTTTVDSALVTSHGVNLSGLQSGTTYHFRVLSRDAAGNLTTSSDFTFTTVAVDIAGPTVTISAPAVTTGGGTTYTFTVTFTDNVAVRVSTLDSSDILVTGPNGFSRMATFVSVNQSTNGKVRTATYRISAPTGGWSIADNGAYTVSIAQNEVTDTSDNAVTAGAIGTFQVAVLDTTAPTALLNATDITIGGDVATTPTRSP
jgi:hypothetical protein